MSHPQAAVVAAPAKPSIKPQRPEFSSGPCAKRPGWTAEAVAARAFLGRSHRAAKPKAQLKDAIDRTARAARRAGRTTASASCRPPTPAPSRWRCGRCSARDPVDMLVWESFGQGWATDATKQLKLDDCRVLTARLRRAARTSAQVRQDADVCFTWNGTTSGARVPNGDWIAADREGLTFCDATSAAFAQDLPWDKLDVTTFSWQKAMGGEGGARRPHPLARAPSSGWRASPRPGRCRRSSA